MEGWSLFRHEDYAQKSLTWMWFEDLDWTDCFWEKIALKGENLNVTIVGFSFIWWHSRLYALSINQKVMIFRSQNRCVAFEKQWETQQLVSHDVKTSQNIKPIASLGVVTRLTCYRAPGKKMWATSHPHPSFSAGISISNVTPLVDDIFGLYRLHCIRWLLKLHFDPRTRFAEAVSLIILTFSQAKSASCPQIPHEPSGQL